MFQRLKRPLLAALLLPTPAFAGTWIVDGAGGGDFTRIQDAIAAAAEGDTIVIRPAQYFEEIRIDGKSLNLIGQDPNAKPQVLESYSPNHVFIVENLGPDQSVLIANLFLLTDGYDANLGASKGTLTIQDCAGSVRVQDCLLVGSSDACAGPSACDQFGGAYVTRSSDVVFVDTSITAGYASCWEDAKGTYSCGGGDLEPALVVEGGGVATNVALFDCFVLGAPGRDPYYLDLYDGWNGGEAAVFTDCFVFASQSIFQGGAGSDADDGPSPHTPGVGGNGGDAVVLTNAQLEDKGCSFLGGVAGVGAPCAPCNPPLPAGADGVPGTSVVGCCVQPVLDEGRSVEIEARQLLPGRVRATFRGQPGDRVDLALSAGGDFAHQPARRGVLGLQAPFSLAGGTTALGTLPAGGELTLVVDVGLVPGFDMHIQGLFATATSEVVLTEPRLVYEALGCSVWPHCSGFPNSTGVSATLTTSGSTSLASNDLVLSAAGLPSGEFGLFFYGFAPQYPVYAATPLGDGRLCIAGGLFRLPPAATSSAQGTVVRPVDSSAAPMGSGPGAVLSGTRVYAQYFYRDAASSGAGFNVSQALTIEFCP